MNIVQHEQEQFDSLPDSQSFETKCSLNVLRRREPLGASANKPEKKVSEGGATMEVGSNGEQEHQQQQQQSMMVRPSVEIVIPNEIGKNLIFYPGYI